MTRASTLRLGVYVQASKQPIVAGMQFRMQFIVAGMRCWLTCFRGSLARSRIGAASSSNFSRVMEPRKSMSFIRHSTFRGASGMELSTFFSCRARDTNQRSGSTALLGAHAQMIPSCEKEESSISASLSCYRQRPQVHAAETHSGSAPLFDGALCLQGPLCKKVKHRATCCKAVVPEVYRGAGGATMPTCQVFFCDLDSLLTASRDGYALQHGISQQHGQH